MRSCPADCRGAEAPTVNTTLHRALGWLLALALGLPAGATAQELPVYPGEGETRVFSEEELDRLLAPVALYPDALLAQVLMASTYPIEVVQAARWVDRNPGIDGEALDRALEAEPWDPSVKALAHFPRVLRTMSEELDWTERLGDAVLAQEADVTATVQRLRRRAHDAAHLGTTAQQRVVVEPEAIVIEPAYPDVVYVPAYDPTVVYGTWWWSEPPFDFYPYTRVASYTRSVDVLFFSTGVSVNRGLWGGFDWHRRHLHTGHHHGPGQRERHDTHYTRGTRRDGDAGSDHARASPDGVRRWAHDPHHRRGVRYRDPAVQGRYGRGDAGAPDRAAGDRRRDDGPRERGAFRNERPDRRADTGESRRGVRPDGARETPAAASPDRTRPRRDRPPTPSAPSEDRAREGPRPAPHTASGARAEPPRERVGEGVRRGQGVAAAAPRGPAAVDGAKRKASPAAVSPQPTEGSRSARRDRTERAGPVQPPARLDAPSGVRPPSRAPSQGQTERQAVRRPAAAPPPGPPEVQPTPRDRDPPGARASQRSTRRQPNAAGPLAVEPSPASVERTWPGAVSRARGRSGGRF
jgi:hypothetical protein